MKIYIVLLEDGHLDIEVEVWTCMEKAIERAKELAGFHNCSYDVPREVPIAGWLFHIEYGAGHSVRVEEKELQ